MSLYNQDTVKHDLLSAYYVSDILGTRVILVNKTKSFAAALTGLKNASEPKSLKPYSSIVILCFYLLNSFGKKVFAPLICLS